MLYNSPQFVIFFSVVYALYLLLGHKKQNGLLLAASYYFYGAWNWKYLSLIIFSTLTTYCAGLKLSEGENNPRHKMFWLWSGIGVNVAILFVFKYYNFFTQNLNHLLSGAGLRVPLPLLHVLLPAGISFYTFQGIAYVVDVYRGRIPAVSNLPDYALFKAFFPQLVAGPIERAEHLLPQVLSPRHLSRTQILEGIYLIFWGMFQKVFLADNLASLVDPVFNAGGPVHGIQSLLVCYAFTFQIFFDFAGYSNIARGLAKMMGFELMINFDRPYLSTNIQEFWNRWHISLSGWVKDYLYMPIFLSLRIDQAKIRAYSAVLLSMLLMGLWHGAGWTFVTFGLYHGILLVLYALLRPYLTSRTAFQADWMKQVWFAVRVIFTFHLVAIGMLLFRAQSLYQAGLFLHKILFDFSGREFQLLRSMTTYLLWGLAGAVLGSKKLADCFKKDFSREMALSLTTGIFIYFILSQGVAGKSFIYFQF